jgi:hypothetical protein
MLHWYDKSSGRITNFDSEWLLPICAIRTLVLYFMHLSFSTSKSLNVHSRCWKVKSKLIDISYISWVEQFILIKYAQKSNQRIPYNVIGQLKTNHKLVFPAQTCFGSIDHVYVETAANSTDTIINMHSIIVFVTVPGGTLKMKNEISSVWHESLHTDVLCSN